MPTSSEILKGLIYIANAYFPLAAVWHIVTFVAIFFLVKRNWRPSRRNASFFLLLPLLSVSILAWSTGKPFNGIMFFLIAIGLGVQGARFLSVPVDRGRPWAVAMGICTLIYALLYPHFLESSSLLAYVIGSPFGLVPCPTLSAVIGFGLMADAFHSRAWALLAGLAGLFYGVVGIFFLGVWLDIGLIIASVSMLILGSGMQQVSGHASHQGASAV